MIEVYRTKKRQAVFPDDYEMICQVFVEKFSDVFEICRLRVNDIMIAPKLNGARVRVTDIHAPNFVWLKGGI